MRRIVLLVVGLGLAAVLVTGLFVLFLPRPEVRLFTQQESYRLGETVEFRLENNHVLGLCYASRTPWGISRLVGEEWIRVEEHVSFQALSFLAPGESLEWDWVAENSAVQESFGLAEVVPGDYRVRFPGRLCESRDTPDPGTGMELFGFFELVG